MRCAISPRTPQTTARCQRPKDKPMIPPPPYTLAYQMKPFSSNSSDAQKLSMEPLIIHLLILIFSFPTSFSAIEAPLFPKEALPTKSGQLVVNSTSGSSIFYAFYEAQSPTSSLSQTPLLIWLQGGPGCSSMFGNFFELGPWRVNSADNSINLKPNPGSWNRRFGLLFLDNPIGTGFSIASSPDEIPRDQMGVARDLYIAIKSFIASNPALKSRPIYITGESYAGKYAPAIGYYILKRNLQLLKPERVKLAGVAIGDGLTHPVVQVTTHADQAYYTGLINEKQRKQLEIAQAEVVKLVNSHEWSKATDSRSRVLQMLQNMTGLTTLYNMRRKTPYESEQVGKFLNMVEAKRALGVKDSSVWEECSGTVEAALHDDVMKSVKYMVELLVKESKVLLYQGQLDLRDGVVSVEAWMRELEWEGIEGFLRADRRVWKVDGEVSGYVQKWGGLTHVVLLDAGHFVPTDQPLNSQAMIEDWVMERGLFVKEEAEMESGYVDSLFEI